MKRRKMTHVYVGPRTAWGLMPNTPCRLTGTVKSQTGGRFARIVDKHGNGWKVPEAKVKPRPGAARG